MAPGIESTEETFLFGQRAGRGDFLYLACIDWDLNTLWEIPSKRWSGRVQGRRKAPNEKPKGSSRDHLSSRAIRKL